MRKIFTGIADFIRESDKLLMILCILTGFYGSLIVLSSTWIGSGYKRFTVQLIGIAVGLSLAIFISIFDYKKYVKFWFIWAFVALVLVGLTFVIGFAPSGTDDKAWLALPFGQSIQPSELLKIAFILSFTAHLTSIKPENISKLMNVILLCAHGAFPVVLIHLQGDDGSAMVLLFIFLTMMYAAGIKLRYFAAAFGAIAVAVPIAWKFVLNDPQKQRILALIHPEEYEAIIYQQAHAEVAIGSGGIFGKGLFNGDYVQSGNIPLGFNDFIFASAGEELGFAGCMLIILMLTFVCFRIMRVSFLARDKQGTIICSGIFAMISAQTIINIGMCTSLLPVIGITLPFFSAGGSSMVCIFIGIGLVLSVYKSRNKRPLTLRDDT